LESRYACAAKDSARRGIQSDEGFMVSLPTLAEDRELVMRMRAGDEAAFEAFADHYIPALYRFAASRLRGRRDLIRDIVQTTICKAIDNLAGYRMEAPLYTWLCSCCRNEIAMYFRLQSNRPAAEVSEELPAPASGPEEALLDAESTALIHRALDHLPPRYSSALQWKYFDGLSVQQIGQRLDVGVKAAESLLTRARQAFRVAWEQLGGRV
jgi:RNA polymerase sigma-70 factor (ECF subfamily)